MFLILSNIGLLLENNCNGTWPKINAMNYDDAFDEKTAVIYSPTSSEAAGDILMICAIMM